MKAFLSGLVVAGSVLVGTVSAEAHTVKKGDTLSEIASKHDMSLGSIANLNPTVHNLDLILVGQEIHTIGKEKEATEKQVSTIETTKETTALSGESALLAKLVEAEARGESYAGKVAVAEVIINRVNSSKFPNSISGVIYQQGQFSPVANGTISWTASQDSRKAVEEALRGVKDNDSLYFYNSGIATSRWLDGLHTTKVVGSHTFKK